MSESAIRASIYNILSSIDGIGKVYDYERRSIDEAVFISLFKDEASGRIIGWEIGRRGASEEKIVLGIGSEVNEVSHFFFIKGYYGLKDSDATEKTFNTLIEEVAEAFRGLPTLNGVAEDHQYIQRDVIEVRIFGSVLCHYAELSLIVTERI